MRNFFKNFIADETGASAAEYALILAVVGSAIVIGAVALGGSIGEVLNETATCIDDGIACQTAAPPPADDA